MIPLDVQTQNQTRAPVAGVFRYYLLNVEIMAAGAR